MLKTQMAETQVVEESTCKKTKKCFAPPECRWVPKARPKPRLWVALAPSA